MTDATDSELKAALIKLGWACGEMEILPEIMREFVEEGIDEIVILPCDAIGRYNFAILDGLILIHPDMKEEIDEAISDVEMKNGKGHKARKNDRA